MGKCSWLVGCMTGRRKVTAFKMVRMLQPRKSSAPISGAGSTARGQPQSPPPGSTVTYVLTACFPACSQPRLTAAEVLAPAHSCRTGG